MTHGHAAHRCLALTAALLSTTVVPTAQAAEAFPARPVRMIIPSGAGGITDILGRVVANKLGERLGQQVLVDNRPGASGIVGSQIVANATPDGHTLLMVFPSHTVNPSLYPDIPYDTANAFAPITMVSSVAPVLLVNAQSPIRSMKDLIAIAKAKPQQLNHASVGSGSMGALAAELLRSLAGIEFTQVAYKGSPQALAAVISGEIDFYFIGSVGTAATQVKTGRVRAIGTGATESPSAMPDVPPIANTIPGFEARGWNGILAPAGTPKAVIDTLNRELVAVIRLPEVGQVMEREGATPVGNTPAEFDKVIRSDIAKWAKILKTSRGK